MITKDMLVSEALKHGNVQAMAAVLGAYGMHCLGCIMAHGETLEQAAEAHGVDVEAMMIDLNKAAESK